jgi:hypothetical protein
VFAPRHRRKPANSPSPLILLVAAVVFLLWTILGWWLVIAAGCLIAIVIAYRILRASQNAEADYIARLSGNGSGQPSAPCTVSSPSVSTAPPPPSRYLLKTSVLSRAELHFHQVLLRAVPGAPLLPKVRVADVIEARESYSGDFLRISQKHFDWVLCDPQFFRPILAIELDDSSHRWSRKQQKNDQVKDEVAREAGMDLLRFPWRSEYDAIAIRAAIYNAISPQDRDAVFSEGTDRPLN